MALSGSSKAFLAVLVLSIGVALGGLLTLSSASSGDDGGEPVTVEISEGMGASAVGEMLAEEGVISSSLAWKVRVRLDDRANRIRPGSYELNTAMSIDEILDVLTTPPEPADTFTVTIPEGLTVEQTLQRLADAEESPFTVEELRAALPGVALPEWVPEAELPAEKPYDELTPYEGLLFPNTYQFRVEDDPQSVLARLIEETDAVVSEVSVPVDLSRYEVLIMASLVEREARVPDERPKIAAVMHNRLAAPMRLQVDATVLYAKGEHAAQVLNRDLEIDSPWNTYRVDGLPPTPISGAGRAAVEAAAHPADTEALYYVVCDPATGRHAFAETNEEHNRNAARFRKVREEGGSFCDEV